MMIEYSLLLLLHLFYILHFTQCYYHTFTRNFDSPPPLTPLFVVTFCFFCLPEQARSLSELAIVISEMKNQPQRQLYYLNCQQLYIGEHLLTTAFFQIHCPTMTNKNTPDSGNWSALSVQFVLIPDTHTFNWWSSDLTWYHFDSSSAVIDTERRR